MYFLWSTYQVNYKVIIGLFQGFEPWIETSPIKHECQSMCIIEVVIPLQKDIQKLYHFLKVKFLILI